MKNDGMILAGRILSLLWAGFWLWFGIASALSGKDLPTAIAHLIVPAVLIIIAAVAAWLSPSVGGTLLVLEGLTLVCLMLAGELRPNNPTRVFFLVLTLALPPIVAGTLLLLGRSHGHTPDVGSPA